MNFVQIAFRLNSDTIKRETWTEIQDRIIYPPNRKTISDVDKREWKDFNKTDDGKIIDIRKVRWPNGKVFNVFYQYMGEVYIMRRAYSQQSTCYEV